jgi:hypothetical protein
MKMNLKQLNDQAIEKTGSSKKMRLSENATSMVFQLFTKNVYSNPIGTVVREITSNCFDSHTEAKVNAPVVIRKSYDKETNTMYISFIDYGMGMSPDRIDNIYSVYFESTKRIDNEQIGGFGIGGKTPLAYKRSTGQGEQEYDNSFNVITIFDKKKYYYLVFEGEESPETVLLYSEDTDEHNGTEVKIPIAENDLYKFEKEMVRQLYYFENVIFEGFEDEDGESSMKNDYQIIRGKNFLFRGHQYDDYMHICLGRVAYPIDFNALGLSRGDYRLPIALKLEVGDINVTVSRESVDYSEGTMRMLKKKLELAKDEVKELLAKQYLDVITLEDYFNVKADFGKLMFPNGDSINLGNMITKNDVKFANFKYGELVKMPSDKHLFNFFFEAKMYGNKPRRSRRYSYDESTVGFFDGGYETILKNASNVLYVNDEFNRKIMKQAFLKENYGSFFIISPKELRYANRKDIADLFSVSLDATIVPDELDPSKYELVPFMKTIEMLQDDYFNIIKKHCKDYDELEIPESFVITRKRTQITKEMGNMTIPIRLYGGGGWCDKVRVKLSELFKFQEPIYYCTKEQEYQIKKDVRIYATLFNKNSIVDSYSEYDNKFNHDLKNKIMFIQIAENNKRYMDFCPDARPLKDLYHTMLYRKVSMVENYFQTAEVISAYSQIHALYKSPSFYRVNAKWSMKAKEVKEFVDQAKACLKNTDGNINNMKYELEKYFNVNAKDASPAQQRIMRICQDIEKFHERNNEVMRYIQLPYDYDKMPEVLVDILKKVMVA